MARLRRFPLAGQSVHALAAYLRESGVHVREVAVSRFPEVEDDEIVLDDDISIQVGAGYAEVGMWVENRTAIRHWSTRTDGSLLLADIREAQKARESADLA